MQTPESSVASLMARVQTHLIARLITMDCSPGPGSGPDSVGAEITGVLCAQLSAMSISAKATSMVNTMVPREHNQEDPETF